MEADDEEAGMDYERTFLEADSSSSSSDEEGSSPGNQGWTSARPFTCSHSYMGEVDDITSRSVFLEEGKFLTLPLFYLQGIVLFPGATLPLRILEPHDKAAVELATHHEEAPCTFGVVHTRANENALQCALVGTTAEIRQSKSMDDGSINIVARGCQRFRTVHVWTNADGVVCAQVRILSEDFALHIPRDAFGHLASVVNFQSGKDPSLISELKIQQFKLVKNAEVEGHEVKLSETLSEQQVSQDCESHNAGDERSNEAYARDFQTQSSRESRRSMQEDRDQGTAQRDKGMAFYAEREDKRLECFRKQWALDASKCLFLAQRSAWPHWVYRMYDAYNLARHAADLWQQIVDLPSICDMVRKPEMLAYHIASKIPVQDATRQELLEIDGVVSRLRREIQLLEFMNLLKCKDCMALIARRSDILVMSTEGPMDAFVNNYGIVHETLTLLRTQGLILVGVPETQYSWFPGYSWTMAFCSVCQSHMGWLYKAVKKGLHPRFFWGVRRSQLAESTTQNE